MFQDGSYPSLELELDVAVAGPLFLILEERESHEMLYDTFDDILILLIDKLVLRI